MAAARAHRLRVRTAEDGRDLEAVLRLRHAVFVEEQNRPGLASGTGLECDAFDPFCDHLLVEDLETGAVIGTYRLLPGHRAAAGPGFYSETFFDLSAWRPVQAEVVELGRSCIHPDYRTGAAIGLLWQGIGDYVRRRGVRYLIGCTSTALLDPNRLTAAWAYLRWYHFLDARPVRPWPSYRTDVEHDAGPAAPGDLQERSVFRSLPPLLKGYLRLGAMVAGPPAYDPAFGTVIFFTVLDSQRLAARYRDHFHAGVPG